MRPVIKTINLRREDVARGAVLRHARALFERDELRYDTQHAAGLSEIVIGEIDDPVTRDVVDVRMDGIEQFAVREGDYVFSRDTLPKGLIAIPIGNRYALKCLLGGLQNPIDLRPNGEITGQTTITNLCAGNIAGFVNRRWPSDHPLTDIRVLGTVVDAAGRPISLREFVAERPPRTGPAPHGVLVTGAGMESGKTTFAGALFSALRQAGQDVTYSKATGTTCFLGDPLRVQTGGHSIEDLHGELVIDPSSLRVSDFVDACGVPSDMSTDLATFTKGTCRFLAGQTGDVCIAELADSVHHRTNVGLLRSPAFRAHFQSLVYVVDPSLDAAQNFLHFLRDGLRWPEVRLAFAGPIATAPEHEALRAEVVERLGVPCVDPADEAALLNWAAAEEPAAR